MVSLETDNSSRSSLFDVFALTEVSAEASPYEYLDCDSIPRSYDAAIYHIRLSKRNRKELTRIFEEHKERITNLIEPLFSDTHSIIFECSQRRNAPTTKKISCLWNSCYSDVYAGMKNKKFLDAFLDAIPCVLAYSIVTMYISLPVPLGLVPPNRVSVVKRIGFLLTSIEMLDSHWAAEMDKYFGPEEVLPRVPTHSAPESLLIPYEETDDLVDFERRPRSRARAFDAQSRSPISGRKARAHIPLKFMYPANGERTFHEDLRPFSQKPKRPDDMSPDFETRSLLMRARCRDVEHDLKAAQMKTTVERTRMIHRYQHDHSMIEAKRQVMLETSEENQQKFMDQLAENQAKRVYLEDPMITLDLLRQQPPTSAGSKAAMPERETSLKQIVDNVLNQCTMEERRRDEVELHCSHEFRNKVLDVRLVFDKSQEPG